MEKSPGVDVWTPREEASGTDRMKRKKSDFAAAVSGLGNERHRGRQTRKGARFAPPLRAAVGEY